MVIDKRSLVFGNWFLVVDKATNNQEPRTKNQPSMNYFLFIAIIFILFLAGCLQPNEKLGCCVRGNITQGCVLENGTNLISTTNSCSDQFCNVYMTGANGVVVDKDIPVCADRPRLPCENPGCTAMVCGPFSFDPSPLPTGEDLNNDANREDGFQSKGSDEESDEAQNLFKAYCKFFPMDSKLSDLMTNTKSSFVNTFRFGVGSSYAEYDEARSFFPISDQFCGLNRAGTVDRYQNYLAPQLLSGGSMPADVNPETLFPDEACITSTAASSPLPFDTTSVGGKKGSYKTDEYYTGVQVSCQIGGGGSCDNPFPKERYNEELSDNMIYQQYYPFGLRSFIVDEEDLPTYYNVRDSGPGAGGFYDHHEYDNLIYFTSKRDAVDSNFYRKALQWIYFENDIDEGKMARYECSTSECMSGYCNRDIYKRSVCINSAEGKFANCLCSERSETDENNNRLEWIECKPAKNYRKAALMKNGLKYDNILTNVQFVFVGRGEKSPNTAPPDSCPAIGINWRQYILDEGFYGLSTETNTEMPSGTMDAADYKDCNRKYYYGYAAATTVELFPFTVDAVCVNRNDEGKCTSRETQVTIPPLFVGLEDMLPPASRIKLYKEPRVGKIPGVIDDETSFIGFGIAKPDEFRNSQLVQECNMQEGDDYIAIPTDLIVTTPRSYNYTDAEERKKDPTVIFGEFDYDDDGNPTGYIREPWVYGYYDEYVQEPVVKSGDTLYSGDMVEILGDLGADIDGVIFKYGRKMPRAISSYFIPIKGLGDCELDEALVPKLQTFGWCEGCTYSTLAYQEVKTLDSWYAPIAVAQKEDITDNVGGSSKQQNWDPICLITARQACTGPWSDLTGLSIENCDPRYSDNYPSEETCSYELGITKWPRLAPTASYLQESSDRLLKAGVLPIIDASDDSNWKRTSLEITDDEMGAYTDAGVFDSFGPEDIREWLRTKGAEALSCHSPTFSDDYCDARVPNDLNLFEHLLNKRAKGRGPFIVIIAKLHAGDDLDANLGDWYASTYGERTLRESYLRRLQRVKENCPKCIAAIHVTNGAMSGNSREERSTKDFQALDNFFGLSGESCYGRNSPCNDRALEKVDMVAYDYYPSELVNEATFSCDGSDRQYKTIVDDMANFSRTISFKYRKPSVIVNFAVPEKVGGIGDDCWSKTASYNGLEGFFNYLFINQQKLVRFGTIGILYKDFRAATPGGSGLMYESYSGQSDWKGDKFCALQKGTKYLVAEAPRFVYKKTYATPGLPCKPCSQIEKSTGACRRTCANGAQCLFDPATLPPGVDPDLDLKCPTELLADGSGAYRCEDSSDVLDCTFTYVNGSSQTIPYNVNELNDLYPDVISSMPYGRVCMLNASASNYTYIKLDATTTNNVPIMFSSKGDPNSECGAIDFSDQSSMCGVTIPIKNYKLNCTIR